MLKGPALNDAGCHWPEDFPFMKKKLRFLIFNLFLTGVTVFLPNTEIVSESAENFFKGNGSMGTINFRVIARWP